MLEIKCKTINSLNKYKYKIKIYDKNCHLIIDDYTFEFGKFYFTFCKNNIYIINISNNMLFPHENNIIFYASNNSYKKLVVEFKEKLVYKPPIILKLTDQFYKDLPIMKGNIKLWKMNK